MQGLSGLCAIVVVLRQDNQISGKLHHSMQRRIQHLCLERATLWNEGKPIPLIWLAPPGEWKPRVTISRRFAEESKNAKLGR